MNEALTGDATGPRTGLQRKADVLEKLQARHADVWVASASEAGAAHLVPLSLAWHEERVMLVTPPESATARNIVRVRAARLALGGTRDVVMIDARLDEATLLSETSSELADAYALQADWDPRSSGGDFVVLLLRPHRIQAWREADEINGRTLMREGRWLV
jgi:hypothetical protein